MLESKAWIAPEDTLQDGRAAPGCVQGEQAAARAPSPKSRWTPPRLEAVEALWGQGYTMPGNGQETLRLVKPLGLSSNNTLILLGSGLGGPAEIVSNTFGAWVNSFEADEELRLRALARHSATGAPSHIRIAGWDRTRPEFKQRSANHALALEALRGHSLSPLLESLAGALRPQGQIVLTELVCERALDEADREFAAWCRLDDRLPALPLVQEVTDGLQKLKFDVRVVEDLTDRHISQTLAGWREAVRAMGSGPKPGAGAAAAFVSEAELWLLRIRLMRRLGVRLMRWHAIGQ